AHCLVLRAGEPLGFGVWSRDAGQLADRREAGFTAAQRLRCLRQAFQGARHPQPLGRGVGRVAKDALGVLKQTPEAEAKVTAGALSSQELPANLPVDVRGLLG